MQSPCWRRCHREESIDLLYVSTQLPWWQTLTGTVMGESGQLVAHALTVYLATDGVEAGCTEHLEQQTQPVAHVRGSPDLQNPQPANWGIHENDEIINHSPSTAKLVHSCELIDVYQERKGLKRYYILKGESLPVTIIP